MWPWPPNREFQNFNFFQTSLKILNVYFGGDNIYFWGNKVYFWGRYIFEILFLLLGGFWDSVGRGGPVGVSKEVTFDTLCDCLQWTLAMSSWQTIPEALYNPLGCHACRSLLWSFVVKNWNLKYRCTLDYYPINSKTILWGNSEIAPLEIHSH